MREIQIKEECHVISGSERTSTPIDITRKRAKFELVFVDQNFDHDEIRDGKTPLHPDSTRDLLKNALNLPEVIGRREKLV